MLKGEATIELKDIHTGEVEVLHEANLVTNALSDVINYASAWMVDRTLNFASSIYPIYNHLLGGVVIFPEVLEEDATKCWAPYHLDPTGFASNVANTGTDVRRGSLNANESGFVLSQEGEKIGYKYVWDFSTHQGNGAVASICLTHPLAGYNWYGCLDGPADGRLKVFVKNQDITGYRSNNDPLWNIPVFTILLNQNSGYAYGINFGTGILYRERVIPFNDIGMHDFSIHFGSYKMDAVYEEAANFSNTNFFKNSGTRYFFPVSDTEILGVSNAGNSSGSASVRWIKINVLTEEYTEGTWSIQAQLAVSRCNVAQSNGYMFWVSYDRKSVYKINLTNVADVKSIPAGFTIGGYDEGSPSRDVLTSIPSGVILGTNFYISNDTIHKTITYGDCQGNNYNLYGGVLYGPYLRGYGYIYRPYGDPANSKFSVSLIPQYLATINNLSSPVTKTADKTMKITYTLTEVE